MFAARKLPTECNVNAEHWLREFYWRCWKSWPAFPLRKPTLRSGHLGRKPWSRQNFQHFSSQLTYTEPAFGSSTDSRSRYSSFVPRYPVFLSGTVEREGSRQNLAASGPVAVRTNGRFDLSRIKIFVVTAVSGGRPPAAIVATMFPGVDDQFVVFEVIVFAGDLILFTFRAITGWHNFLHDHRSRIA